MFKVDLYVLLLAWKANNDEILLFGDFNKNLYTGELAKLLSGDDLRMIEMCCRTTGVQLPSTHIWGRMPIEAVYATSGLGCAAVTLLASREGIGDHRVFLFDIKSNSLLGDVFPWVIPIARQLYDCALD